MILVVLASFPVIISHTFLYCFTSWRHTHQSIVRGNVCNTCIPHGEYLKEETRDGADIWELGCQGAPLLENCERCLNRAHRHFIMCPDVPNWVRDDGGNTWQKRSENHIMAHR
jgi:hypothetical protein